jgi:hypothetical protein
MRSIEKNRKQGSNLPISIKLVVKIVLVVIGFSVWGNNFLWIMLGVYLGWGIIKGVLSCLISLIVLVGILSFLLSLIF